MRTKQEVKIEDQGHEGQLLEEAAESQAKQHREGQEWYENNDRFQDTWQQRSCRQWGEDQQTSYIFKRFGKAPTLLFSRRSLPQAKAFQMTAFDENLHPWFIFLYRGWVTFLLGFSSAIPHLKMVGSYPWGVNTKSLPGHGHILACSYQGFNVRLCVGFESKILFGDPWLIHKMAKFKRWRLNLLWWLDIFTRFCRGCHWATQP